MERKIIKPRTNLAAKLEERGMLYHQDYYTETSCYRFTASEIDKLEAATNELFGMCLKLVAHVVDNNLWNEFHIPAEQAEFIKKSWKEDDVSIYGRFDLGYNSKTGGIKLLEFNADTPTSLLEASVIQWDWLQEAGNSDQWNSLHERLVAHFKECAPHLQPILHFAVVRDSVEDYMNVAYLKECAEQAGLKTEMLYVDEISLDGQNRFCDADDRPIHHIFKLYPWEWIMREEFGEYLNQNYGQTTWIEPPWKAILSNKMLLVHLWKMFPNHQLLLEAEYMSDMNKARTFLSSGDWCVKPVYSREGANTTIIKGGQVAEHTSGDYGHEGYIAQQFFEIEQFEGWTPVLGTWVVAGEAAGMGIREQKGTRITGNMAGFAAHYFE